MVSSSENWAGPGTHHNYHTLVIAKNLTSEKGEEAAAQFGLSHAVILPPNARTILVGGQVGIADDGSVPTSVTEEVDLAFAHVEKALKAAGLGDDAWEHVYKVYIGHYLTSGWIKPLTPALRSPRLKLQCPDYLRQS